jgi:hypothetical protein
MSSEGLAEGPGSQTWKKREEVMWEMTSEDLVEGPCSQSWNEVEDLNTPDAALVLVLMVI